MVGDYLVQISLGTPPVEFIAVADTGSDLIWVQCLPCTSCIPQPSPPFDPSKSSTFQIIPCTSPSCNLSDLQSGCSSSNNDNNNNEESLSSSSSPCMCIYQNGYGDGTQTNGILATETITLLSPNHDDDSTSSIN